MHLFIFSIKSKQRPHNEPRCLCCIFIFRQCGIKGRGAPAGHTRLQRDIFQQWAILTGSENAFECKTRQPSEYIALHLLISRSVLVRFLLNSRKTMQRVLKVNPLDYEMQRHARRSFD